MARNIEIKAPLADLAAARAVVVRLGALAHAVEEQTDRYFTLDGEHRVKLRTIGGGRAELIDYRRGEHAGVRASEYTVSPVRHDGLCAMPKGDPIVVVRKRREILLWDNVRIHLDTVERLGTFLELEAVVDAQHDEAACREQVAAVLAALAIGEVDLIRASYAELLLARSLGAVGRPR